MWSNVRASLVVALALTACSDDSDGAKRGHGGPGEDDPSGVPGGRDGGRERPNGAVAPMSPACEALHGETVFQSDAFATVVHDARASDDGYVALLLDEQAAVDAPVQSALRVVRTPGGAARTDVALAGSVLALSDVRAGRMLVVEGGSELLGPVAVTALDLATGTAATSTLLEDASDQPRVHYDDAGQVAHQVASRALTVAREGAAPGALQIAQLADGGHAVLAHVLDPLPTQGQAAGVWLFVRSGDGQPRARIHVKTMREGALGGTSLLRGPDDRLHVLTTVHRSERAGFERIHGRTLRTPDFERLPVVLSFSPGGALIDLHETVPADCAAPLDAVAVALDADAAGLAWSGSCDGGTRTWLATAPAAPEAATTVTPLSLGPSPRIGSLLRHASGAVLVAGARNFAPLAPGSLSAAGDAVLARIEADGTPSLTCPYDTARSDRFTLRRSERPLMILQYDAGIGDATGEDARAQSVVRYLAP